MLKNRSLTISLLAIMLAGCAGSGTVSNDPPIATSVDMTSSDHGPFPSNYDALIKQWVQENLKDPASARYGSISRPRKEFMVDKLKPYFGYSVCADINAKNSYGGYTGAQTFWFMIRDGRIVRSQSTQGFPGRMISRDHFVNCQDGP